MWICVGHRNSDWGVGVAMNTKHLSVASKYIKEVPDWAQKCRLPVSDADFETAVLAQMGMPTSPMYYAERHIGEITELVSWDSHTAVEVRTVIQ
jgi:hypothetical protein